MEKNLSATIKKCLENSKNKNVLVIGDIMVDNYINGEINRISPEAPVQVLNVENEYTRLGGAANVAHGLSALGVNVSLCGVVGDDTYGTILKSICKDKNINTDYIIETDYKPTIRKVRIISRNQQMLRLDWESTEPITKKTENKIIDNLEKIHKLPDIIVLSDYNKGTLTKSLCRRIIQNANDYNIPVITDPKSKDFKKYKGSTIITPNVKELQDSLDMKINTKNDKSIISALFASYEQVGIRSILLTMDKEGMIVWRYGNGIRRIPAITKDIYDVTGAGDSVVVALTFSVMNNLDFYTSAIISNSVAGIVVSKFGTSIVTPDELINSFSFYNTNKVFDRGSIKEKIKLWKNEGKKIVFTNGCFDLFHIGHLYLLNQASKYGDILIVGVNTDDSIRLNKGNDRPLINENERANIVSNLESVNGVILFNEKTPLELIKEIEPDILVKGSDYKKENIVGKDIIESYGGEVITINLLPNKSTSSLIQKIKGNNNV